MLPVMMASALAQASTVCTVAGTQLTVDLGPLVVEESASCKVDAYLFAQLSSVVFANGDDFKMVVVANQSLNPGQKATVDGAKLKAMTLKLVHKEAVFGKQNFTKLVVSPKRKPSDPWPADIDPAADSLTWFQSPSMTCDASLWTNTKAIKVSGSAVSGVCTLNLSSVPGLKNTTWTAVHSGSIDNWLLVQPGHAAVNVDAVTTDTKRFESLCGAGRDS